MSENEKYNLINPDAYDYLDNIGEDEIQKDAMLEEQEELQDAQIFDEEDEVPAPVVEDPYSNDLFSFDEKDEVETVDEEAVVEETENKNENEYEITEEDTEDTEDTDGELSMSENIFENDFENEKPEITISQELLSVILQKISKYSPVKDFFRTLSEDQLNELDNMICQTKNAWMCDHKDKMFSVSSDAITFAVVSDTDDPLKEIQRFETLAVNMIRHEREEWSVVYLYFDNDGLLIDARDRRVNKSLFTERQWKVIEMQAGRLGR